MIGSWQLDGDEALILEVAPPEGLYWSFSLGNPWWETIDYARHQSSLNGHQSAIDDDGLVRAVVGSPRPRGRQLAGHRRPQRRACDPSLRADRFGAGTIRPRREVLGRRRRPAIEHPPRHPRGAQRNDRGPTTRGEQEVLPMTLDAEELEAEARQKTGLDDFGDAMFHEGLERLVRSFNEEADLTEAGDVMQHMRLVSLLSARLQVEDTYRTHPAIDDEEIEGPVFVIGLPRTGTTALSQLVAADPQFRSLRMWESSSPCPPPESATEHSDPRIADAEAGLAMMYEMFPLMAEMHHQEATTATECQDLLGMSFRTVHFDGFGYVPSYLAWVTDCDMRGTYQYHRRVLQLLQWHCPPRLWHLKTPVHMFALDALLEAYPDAKFLWSHRDPAKVLGRSAA